MNFVSWSHNWFKKQFSEGIYEYIPKRFNPIVEAYLGPIRGSILDAACGLRNALWNVEVIKCKESVGLDIDEMAIKKNTIHKSFIHKDLHDLSIENRFEGIFSVYTWEHLENPMKVLKNFYRALLPGGTLVIMATNRYYYTSVIERLLPKFIKDIAWRLLKGKSHMPYPTFYRMCTKQSIREAAEGLGFKVVHYSSLDGPPLWFAKIPPLFILFTLWIKLTNRFSIFENVRGLFIVVLQKAV